MKALFVIIALAFAGCYSFTGSSIPAHLHTIGIPLVQDNSGYGQSQIRQDLTNQLVTKFTRDGSLQVRDRAVADALLEVTVTTITDQAVAVRAGDQLTNKRVTISVDAIYQDQKKQKTIWQRGFSQSADYPISGGLDALNNAIKQAEDKLSDDLLLGVISNW
ncbi:MAG: LptE family protein [Bacteroidetes bacterium]|nr:LptE family protein [Bacteroidota bacterium]